MKARTQTFQQLTDAVSTMLGPLGTSALVVGADGSVDTTATATAVLDGVSTTDPTVTVLEQSLDQHRATAGDGTRSLLVLSSELITRAIGLVDDGLHPTSIVAGYNEALAVAVDQLAADAFSLSVVEAGDLVTTALTTLRDPVVKRHLADRLDDAAETMRTDPSFDPRSVAVVSRLGDPLSETELLRGVVLDQEPVLETMPRHLHDVGIALLTDTVDVRTVNGTVSDPDERRVSLRSGSFEDRTAVREWERESFEEAVSSAEAAGCRVVLTTRAVNDRVKTVLDGAEILAVQRVDESDVGRIAKATGATPVPRLEVTDTSSLGHGTVRVERKAGDDMVEVRSTANEPVYTLFCRAPDERRLDAFERGVETALASLLAVTTTEDGVVAGGGAVEMSAARAVRRHARSVDDRRSLAVEAFGDALATIPARIATNAGMERPETMATLRAAHAAGDARTGVDALDRAVRNVVDDDPIVDAERIARQRWTAGTELAVQLARVDDVLHAGGEGADA